MYATFVLFSVHLFTASFTYCTAVSAEAVHSAHLLPDGLSAFGDFDILRVDEEGDEDVVHLRKRTDNECNNNDCLDYSAWNKDSIMHCPDAELEGGEGLVGRSLVKRNPKKKNLCDGVEVDGVKMSGISIYSPRWKDTKYYADKYKMVYDIGDPKDPLKSDWYKLTKHQKKWTTNVPGKGGDRCYNAEHILEWQMLAQFIEEDKDQPNSRCEFMYKFFAKEGDMPKTKIKVPVAKSYDKKLSDGDKFDYEDREYDFSKFKGQARPIDWVTHQWPGKIGNTPPNPWEYEMVLLNEEINNKKADVWAGSKIFPERVIDTKTQKMSQKNQDNSKTLEWLFDNKYYDGKQVGKWADNKGKCKAISMFNDVMGLVHYHNDPYVREVMRAQVNRVGAAWEYLEKTVLKDAEWKNQKGNVEKFKERGLKKEWLDWVVAKNKKEMERLPEALKDKVGVFEGASTFTSILKRWDVGNLFSRELKKPNCGSEKDDKVVAQRVKLLLDAYKKLPALKTELKLD